MIALACPNCRSTNLATSEDLSGSAYGTATIVEGERVFDHDGWTEVWWDSSQTTGVECRDCDWSATDDEGGMSLLMPVS